MGGETLRYSFNALGQRAFIRYVQCLELHDER